MLSRKTLLHGAILLALIFVFMTSSQSQAQEVIDATALGTSTQLGRDVPVKLIINRFSTPEERQAVIQAFQKGQNQGLYDALQKMKPDGRIQIPGTVGYDLAFVYQTQTPTGRQIRFVTNRRIQFREAYNNTRSQAYDLTAGEINIDTQDKNKSQGVLYPAAQFVINKNGELEIQLLQNPWRLTNIIVRGKIEQ